MFAATLDDVRATMIEGPSGVLRCSPEDFRPTFDSSVLGGQLTWPNGNVARGFSGESPNRCRGQQSDTDWFDDLAAWGTNALETWKQAQWGFRTGVDPRAVISSTPKDVPILLKILEDGLEGLVIRESIADSNRLNLAPSFFKQILKDFEGTEDEQQERYGKLIREKKGNPFSGIRFATHPIRVRTAPKRDDFEEVIIAIDPAATSNAQSDETGLLVMGRTCDGHIYVLDDLSGKHPAEVWGRLAIDAYEEWKADRFVAEINRGEGLVRQNIHAEDRLRRLERGLRNDGAIEFLGVRAREGKRLRAGPVRVLYMRGTLHHLTGLDGLEEQMRKWDPSRDRQPDDRIDALVHGAVHLGQLEAPSMTRRAATSGISALNQRMVRPDAHLYETLG